MVRTIIDGQKAGEGSAKQPEIAPDSARSVTKLKQVIGLSEGEIGGFDKSDIKLENTPLSELSPEIICSYRFGTLNQEYIEGVDEVANEIGVGVELRGDLDWIKQITNTDIDHVGIRLRWGPLQTNHTNGDITGVFIAYEIQIAPVNGSYEKVLSGSISDKTSDSYERYHEFKLPESSEGWMIKVIRLTQSAESSLISDKMYVQAYAEIIKSKFTFPYTSFIYLEYDARSFANVAKVAVNAKGMIIKVPSNYDPVTRQYTGLWNGSFKMAYSNNPAWVYYDLVTQRRYGCGDRIDQSMVDKWSLYRLAQYCDQLVPDGYGGQEPRFTCNVYLQSKERVYDVLNRLTGLFRAINFWNGSQLVVDADIPQDSSYLYTNANVVDGLFEYAGTAATDLYSAAKVAWDNPANGYNTEFEAVSYEHLVKKLGFKVLELDAWGCTSRGQALRAGRWALLAESDTITFKVGMDGYLAMPGKIIEVQDEFYAGKSNGGRVISISESGLEVTLDRPVETIAGDTISFNTAFGSVQKFDIVSSAGSVVTLATSVGSSVERMHIWVINSSQLATQKYRILTVKYDGVGEFTISAVEYNPNKYEEIDSNVVFDEPPTSIINPVAQIAVKNVTISSNEYVYQGLNTVNLEINWERAENAVEYLVEFKKDDGSWIKLPSTGNSSIVLENVYAGYYIAKVTAVSAYELKSLPTYSVKTNVLGKQSTPLPPLNPRVQPIQFGIEFYWDFPQGSSDTAVSRIAVSYLDPTGLVDESGLLIYDKAYSDNKVVIQNLDLHTRVWFKVKLIDKLGFESPYTDWVSGLPSQDIDKVMDLISGQIEQSDLYDDLSQKIEIGFGASAAATNAQTAADQAQVFADQAKTAADEVLAKVNTEVLPQLNNLDVGLTQEITNRQDGDDYNLSELNAYKLSNDNAVAAAMQQATTAISTTESNAALIGAVQGQLTNLEGDVQQKADNSVVQQIDTRLVNLDGVVQANNSAVLLLQGRTTTLEGEMTNTVKTEALQNYYTKQQANDATAGQINEFNASLVIGGTNLLNNTMVLSNTSDTYRGGKIYRQTRTASQSDCIDFIVPVANLDAGDYTLSFDIKSSIDVPAMASNPSYFFAPNTTTKAVTSQGFTATNSDGRADKRVTTSWQRIWITWTQSSATDTKNLIINRSFGIGVDYSVDIANIKFERGNKATAWTPADSDIQNELNANASTLAATNATVAQQGNQIIAHTDAIQSAESRIANNEASIQNIQSTYATRDSVGSLAQIALESVWQDDITKAVGDISVGGVNLLSNTAYLSASNPPQVLGGSGYFLSGLNPNYHAGTSSTGENHFVIDNVYAERYIRIQAAVSNTSTLKPNTTYTFSVKIRGAAKPLGFRIIVRINGVFTDLPIKMIEYDNDVFSTHGYTFTTPLGTTYIIISLQSYNANIGESFAIQNSSMKLEEGNVVTAWTPSTSEVQAQIDASATAVSTLTTEVSSLHGQVSALSTQTDTLSTTVGNNTAAIQLQQSSIDGINAKATLQVEAGGTIGGVALGNNGGVVNFLIRSNTFAVTTPEGVQNDTKYMMTYQANDQTLPNGTVIPKGLKVNDAIIGTINASKIYADSLSAISANLGTIKVDTAHIGDAAVTNAKIADLAVDTLKIQGNSVTVPTVAYTVAAVRVSSAWTTIQSITAQSSLGLTLFNFNWLYASTRSDTRYIVNYRILKNGVVVVDSSRIFFFEVNFSNNSATASPSGTLSLNYSDSTLIDGTYELQVQLSAGSNMNFLNRYASALVVRR